MMFRSKRRVSDAITDEIIEQGIKESQLQKENSEKELERAKETVSILKKIREENHIVHDLREVFSGH